MTATLVPTIRRARLEDTSAIAALTEAAYAKHVPVLGRRPAPMDWDYHRVVAEWQAWVAEDNAHLIGALLMVPEESALLIESIAVFPAAQGRGLGRRLIDHAFIEARRQGLAAVRLYTNARMTDNIAFYGRYGFRESARQISSDRHIVHMEMALDQQPPRSGPL